MISVTGIWLQTHFRGVDVKHLSKAHPVSNMLLFIYNLVFSECEKKGCKDISCQQNRQQAVKINKSRGIYGYLSEVLFKILFEKYLLVQHLWVNYILLADNPERSKFLAKYACVKDLHKLIVAGVRIAITKKKIKCICRNGKNITYYYTKFTTAVGSYIDRTRGLLYQFTICIIFEDGSLANAFPFGKGFRIPVKPKNLQVVLNQAKNTKETAPMTTTKPLSVTTTHQPVPTEAAPKKGRKGKEEKVSTFTWKFIQLISLSHRICTVLRVVVKSITYFLIIWSTVNQSSLLAILSTCDFDVTLTSIQPLASTRATHMPTNLLIHFDFQLDFHCGLDVTLTFNPLLHRI